MSSVALSIRHINLGIVHRGKMIAMMFDCTDRNTIQTKCDSPENGILVTESYFDFIDQFAALLANRRIGLFIEIDVLVSFYAKSSALSS